MKCLATRYQQIMEGTTQASSRHREIAVDLWLDLRGHVASEAWAADLSAKPSRVLQDAGRLWEASLTAEHNLASGHGDRCELLGRLVSLYTELGEYEMAIQKLLAKMAEEPIAEDKELLRWLQDRLSGA